MFDQTTYNIGQFVLVFAHKYPLLSPLADVTNQYALLRASFACNRINDNSYLLLPAERSLDPCFFCGFRESSLPAGRGVRAARGGGMALDP